MEVRSNGEDHEITPRLISEFAALQPTGYNQNAWELTFTTYLQPSDKAEDFKLITGLENDPVFSGLVRNALRIIVPFNPSQCFKSGGDTQYGPLTKSAVQEELGQSSEVEDVPAQFTDQSQNNDNFGTEDTTNQNANIYQQRVAHTQTSNLGSLDLGPSVTSTPISQSFGKGQKVTSEQINHNDSGKRNIPLIICLLWEFLSLAQFWQGVTSSL